MIARFTKRVEASPRYLPMRNSCLFIGLERTVYIVLLSISL